MASDPLQYYIGKGVVSFTPTGGTKRDLGNVPELELTPEVEKLDHFSSRTGVKSKDRSIIVSKGGTVRLVMEEFQVDNLALMVMGEAVADTIGGGSDIDIFSKTEITGELEFASTNDVGPLVTMTLYNVSFQPGASLSLISEEWGQMELTGELLVSTEVGDTLGKFGTMKVTPATA